MSETKKPTVKKPVDAVRIAKDVLKYLDGEKLVAMAGTYFEPYDNSYHAQDTHGTDLKKFLDKLSRKKRRCEVCALGALFYANVRLNNEVKVGTSTSQDNLHTNLRPYFSDYDLYLIEAAFECNSSYGAEAGVSWDDRKAACRFGSEHPHLADRLTAICKNIIANKGVFTP